MIKLILFDIGGVVIEVPSVAYYNYLSNISGIPPAEIMRRVAIDVSPFERGEMSLKRFVKTLSLDLGIREKDVTWLKYFEELVRLNGSVAALIKQLDGHYKIGYLSNVDRCRYNYVKKNLLADILYLFDYQFASFELGCTKPSPIIYQKVLQMTNTKPSEVLFIDNDWQNVEAARRLGIRSILFTHATVLRKELKLMGIKI